MNILAKALLRIALRRAPDFTVGGALPYLQRWHVIPRNPWFNIYLHRFLRSDDDRALHDHPYRWNFSWLLRGRYLEWVAPPKGEIPPSDGIFMHADGKVTALGYYRTEGEKVFRWGAAPHRIELHKGECWTLFITGDRVREWGFYCPQGWRHWKEFTAPGKPGQIGKGCGE